MKASALFVFFITLILAVSGCSNKDKEKPGTNGTAMAGTNESDEKKDEELRAVPVEVTTIAAGKISSFVLTNASLETEETVDVFPQVTGLVVRLLAEEGEDVQKGAPLLEIDEREYKLREEAGRVNFEKQKNAFERSQSMFDKQLLSAAEFENAKLTMEQARIEWEQAKLTLDYCKIKAPISGIVSERLAKVGDRLLTTTKIYSLVNPDLLLAKIHLTEKDALRTKVGQRAEIISEALPGQTFIGQVDRISPVVDATSGMVRVTIQLQDRKRLLKPGMFVNVHLITDSKANAALVPKRAVIYDDNHQFVFVVRHDTLAIKVPLTAGYTDRDNIEALGGVSIGDTIIIVGHNAMKDSARVKIAEMKI
jgi:membrane fusion protein (multidrug efflux system)